MVPGRHPLRRSHPAPVAERTVHELDRAGIRRIADADKFSRDDLDHDPRRGRFARYDVRTATRLDDLAKVRDRALRRFGRRVRTPIHRSR